MKLKVFSNPRIDNGEGNELKYQTDVVCGICTKPASYYIDLNALYICKRCCSDMIDEINNRTMSDIQENHVDRRIGCGSNCKCNS